MADEKKQKTNWFWPKIVDITSAKEAAKAGYWAALIVAIVTGVVATIVLITQNEVMNLDLWSYVDAVLFGFIAWRIKKYSKVFAVIGVVLFFIEKALLVPSQGASGWPLAVLILLMFINGARGVFAYHRFSSVSSSVSTTSQNV